MANFLIIVLLVLMNFMLGDAKEIHDPLNIFCGPINCYNILGVERAATSKDIKKAYRKLSLSQHPDKSKAENATEIFRTISKAYEVLEGNASRVLFDYYLDHPRDYFKVSGQHYFRNLPKSDARLVIFLVILLISWFIHTVKYQRYVKVVKFLANSAQHNLGPKNGGSVQTQELYNRATEAYEVWRNKDLSSDDKVTINKSKMLKDPQFAKIVLELAYEIKIEGGFKKPETMDLFAVQILFLPYTIFKWLKKYYRRNISTKPFTDEEKIEMSIEAVGMPYWEESSAAEKSELVKMEIWKAGVLQKWAQEGLEAGPVGTGDAELDSLLEQLSDDGGVEDGDSSSPGRGLSSISSKSAKLLAKKAKKAKAAAKKRD